MKTNVFTRLALFGCLTVCLSLPAVAQAPAPSPTITFNLPNGATVSRASGLSLIIATAKYTGGVRSLAVSGANAGASAFYPNGYLMAWTNLYFYTLFHPAGDYTFTATATGDDGHATTQSILVHLK